MRSLARGLEILRAFQPGESVLGNQEIAQRTGLSKPTVSRLTHTLTALGYLVHEPRLEKYRLGSAVLALGYAALSDMAIREIARPLMQRLADDVGGSVALGNRDRLSIIYIQHCRSQSTVTLRMDVGMRVPIALTAIGRAFLAGLPEAERRYLTERLKASMPRRWHDAERAIGTAESDIQARGFCTALGDWQRDVWAVGAPVVSRDGRSVLAMNCCVPAYAAAKERMIEEFGPRLAAIAGHVSRELAGRL